MTEEIDSIGAVASVAGAAEPQYPAPVASSPAGAVPPVAPTVTPSRRGSRGGSSGSADLSDSSPAPRRSSLDLATAVQELNAHLASGGRVMELRSDTSAGVTVAVIKNAQTGAVLQQMPSEDVLRLAEMLSAWSGGRTTLVDVLA